MRCLHQMQLTTFKPSLKSKDFVFALAKNPPASMVEFLLKAQKYINAGDALVVIGIEDTQKDKGDTKEYLKGRRREKKDTTTTPPIKSTSQNNNPSLERKPPLGFSQGFRERELLFQLWVFFPKTITEIHG